jgi:hypothetical protein
MQGLPETIDPDKHPKKYKDAATSRPDNKEWAKADMDEYLGFKERQVFVTVALPKGAKVVGTTTHLDYKMDNRVLNKRKVRMCVQGDQRTEESFSPFDLYSPVLKATGARLLAAIAAEHGCSLLKTDTRQAFLYEDMGDDKVHIRFPPRLARACTWRSCSPDSQNQLWHKGSRKKVVPSHFWMDG